MPITITVQSTIVHYSQPDNGVVQEAFFYITDGANGVYLRNLDRIPLGQDVPTYLNAQSAQLWVDAVANGTPLSGDELAAYQDLIDAKSAQTQIDALQAVNVTMNSTVVGDPNVPTGGYKDVFKPSGTYGAMTNAVKFAVLGTAMFAALDALVTVNKAVILLLRIQKRQASAQSQAAGK